MKRMFLVSFFVLSVTGCTQFSESFTNLSDSLGATPAWEKEVRKGKSAQRLETPSVRVDEKIPEGEYVDHFENGSIRLKTIVKDRCFDQYLETYYINGQLHTATPIKNCKSNGLSKGYLEDGSLSTEIFFNDGKAHGIARQYAPDGSVIQEIEYKDGYPVRVIK